MKKHTKKLVILLLVAVFAMSFVLLAACKGGVEGTYYLWGDGKLYKTQYYTLKKGEWTNEAGESGEYEVNGTAITLYINFFGSKEEYFSGTVKDGELILTTFGVKMYFYKEGSAPKNGTTPGDNQQPPKKQYTVTYDANGGTFADGNTFSQEVEEGSKLTAPTSPTRNNYTFAGWAKNKSGSTMWKFDEDTVTENTTLYAQWTQKSAVILSVDGASMDGDSIYIFVTHEIDSVSLSNKVVCSDDSIWRLYYDRMGQTEIPTKVAAGMSGYLMNGENVFYIVVTSQNGAQVNLYELTVYRSYAVNVNYYNGNELLKSDTTYTGLEYTTNYTPNITGYTFNGWKDSSGKAFTTDTIWGTTSLYADKTANTYTANLSVNGGDALSESTKTMTYGSSYTLPVPTRTGYSFTGWYVGSTQITSRNGSSLAEWDYASTTTVTAHWQANEYKLTLSRNNTSAGTVTGDGTYAYDSEVTITATTNVGYIWVGWFDGNTKLTDDQSYSFTMNFTKNSDITAKWNIIPELEDFIFASTEKTCAISSVVNNTVTKFTIPECVTSIKKGAFDGCAYLTTVYWNAINCQYESSPELKNCPNLKTVVFGENVQVIPTAALNECSGITSIIIPENVISIGSHAFANCSNLETVYWNAIKCEYTGDHTVPMFHNSAKTVILGENVQVIPNYAFKWSHIRSITIPNSVTTIGIGAFYNCNSLTSIIFENPVDWWVAKEKNATSEIEILASDLADSAKATKYLTGDYCFYYWKRG